jgi:predicted DCC family thiol-disulfide oxidoreductase YuxK
MIKTLPKDKNIILFDGVCNLCNSSINRVIDNDKSDVFRLVSLQSELGIELQKYLGIQINSIDSIILYIPQEAYYIRSTAALKIMNEFSGMWKLTNIFYLIPSRIRDAFYNFVARNRYKWFGKGESCRIMTPEIKEKFL